MIKSIINRLGFPWEEVIILIVTIIGFGLITVPLRDLTNHFLIVWMIFDQIPCLIVIIYAYFHRTRLPELNSSKVEVRLFYRYLLFLIIVTGLVFIAYSIASIIITAPVLFQIDMINDITRDFSIWFYFKVLIVAPLIEEYLFRGIILNGFLKRYSPSRAIILTTILFSLMHLNPVQYFITFLLGLLTGWYFYKTRNLLSCMIIHSLSNLIGILMLKYFIDRLYGVVITSGTKLIQFDNLWLVFILSASLILVGLFYLFKSLILNPADEHLITKST